jgi:hypothetical protein
MIEATLSKIRKRDPVIPDIPARGEARFGPGRNLAKRRIPIP